jgi:predicted glutamine amidotransferase
MCGIFGFQCTDDNNLTEYEAGILGVTLASEMEGRGKDSFGVALFDPTGKIDVIKGLGKISEKGSHVLREISVYPKILGHTRAATVGEVSIPNAHPFEVGNIIGVHNGSVGNYKEMNEKYGRTFEVDSQHLFAHINEDLPLLELSGYGVVFYASKSNDYKSIRFFKTNGGNISVANFYRSKPKADGERQNLVVWASEWRALDKAANLLGMDMRSLIINPDTWYKIENGEVFEEKEASKNFRGMSTWSSSRSSGNTHEWNTLGLSETEKSWLERRRTERQNAIKGTTSNVVHGNFSTPSADGIHKLSKAQKKALRRKSKLVPTTAHFEAMEAEWEKLTSDPVPDNLVPIERLRSVMLRNADSNSETFGEVELTTICPRCNDPLKYHIWGMCLFNSLVQCQGKQDEACKLLTVKMCRDCGHFLSTDIHTKGELTSNIWCNQCSCYCIPESELVLALEGNKAHSGEESTSLVVLNTTTAQDPDEATQAAIGFLTDKENRLGPPEGDELEWPVYS